VGCSRNDLFSWEVLNERDDDSKASVRNVFVGVNGGGHYFSMIKEEQPEAIENTFLFGDTRP